jgi:hypothetical protein
MDIFCIFGGRKINKLKRRKSSFKMVRYRFIIENKKEI